MKVPSMHRSTFFLMLSLASITASALAQENPREVKVRADRVKVEAEGFWIYNDVARGFAEAKKTGKPLLVVLRCIPCEECVKLDDDLVDQDPVIRPLLEDFVCVRQVSTNGLDLDIFQYDTDQSFAVFLLNADGTIYGRFGTRSHRTDWLQDVSLPGMAKALQGALALHAEYPSNKDMLASKRGQPLEFDSPEKFPLLKDKYTDKLAESGSVVASCIHCHQIGDARRSFYRSAGKPIPDRLFFPYPHPKSIGLVLDPQEQATVLRIEPQSPAAEAGFKADDEIQQLAGQPLLSVADVQWVLDSIDPKGGQVAATVQRDGQLVELQLHLQDGWRAASDISWRVSTWNMRGMATGGMVLQPLTENARQAIQLAPEEMALLVKSVGQYGKHAAAKKSGFKVGDVIVSFDGHKDFKTEAELLKHGVQQLRSGDQVTVSVRRGDKTLNLTLPMQD